MQCVWEVNLHLPGRKAVSVWLQVLCSLSAKCVEVKRIENGQLSTVKFHRGVKKGMRGLRLACFLKGTSALPCFNLTFKKKMTYRTHCCTEEKRWNKKRKRIKLHGIHHSKHCYQDLNKSKSSFGLRTLRWVPRLNPFLYGFLPLRSNWCVIFNVIFMTWPRY